MSKNKKIIFGIATIVLFIIIAAAIYLYIARPLGTGPLLPSKEELRACSANEDCLLVQTIHGLDYFPQQGKDNCGCLCITAINKKYQALWENEMENTISPTICSVLCKPCPFNLNNSQAECENNQCSVKAKAKTVYEGLITIVTDKTEYQTAKDIKLTITNNSNKEIIISACPFSQRFAEVEQKLNSGRWEPIVLSMVDVICTGPFYLQKGQAHTYTWQEFIPSANTADTIFNPPGAYRIKFGYVLTLPYSAQPTQWIYSNEFEIKEKIEDLEETSRIDTASNVEIVARENKPDSKKTDIFIKDLSDSKEKFYITLDGINRRMLMAEFHNGHLYILTNRDELWQYNFPGDPGKKLAGCWKFTVSLDEKFLACIVDYPIFPARTIEDYQGPSFYSDALVIINLNTAETKAINNVYTGEILNYLKEIPPYALQHYLSIGSLQWSEDNTALWTRVDFQSSADPPVPIYVNFLKINTKNWQIEKFSFPPSCAIMTALNPTKTKVLYDCVIENGSLVLCLYDLTTMEEKIIVSYSAETVSTYFKEGGFSYKYPGLIEGTEPRWLNPKWINDDSFSFLDFETREEIIKKLDEIIN